MTFVCGSPYIILSSCERRVTDNSLPEKTVTSWISTSNTAAGMNGKFALALLLALQVSVSLCDVPPPDKELVEKYESLKAVFGQRLLNANKKFQAAFAQYANHGEASEPVKAISEYMSTLEENPHVKSVVKIAGGLAQEVSPLVERTRLTGLGLYGHYLRPYIGTYLDDSINYIKAYLDAFIPAA
ncbi:apolipoprotein A-II [Lampris incognitus]|uniref:apolipoprotein A-II n=1 Tax=Lampris incognitus TaxID=2546036 RepID=UPI0024B60F5F|nr:apolipoprotein A-II [Lampris incognitus]